MKKRILSLLIIPFLASCTINPTTSKMYFFDTLVNITLYEKNDKTIDDINKILKEIHELTDNYSSTNEISKINKNEGEYDISQGLFNLLTRVKELESASKGYFNSLVGSLVKAWKEKLSNKEILSQTAILEELDKLNNSSYSLKQEGSAYKLDKVGEAALDFGAVAKGYALDKIKSYLDSTNIHRYIIDGGSSSILLGHRNKDGGNFKVGLKDTKNAYVELSDCFIGASGTSEQGVTIDGVTYSHIVNPFTGSVINNYDLTFVTGNNGALCDVLSTSFMMMELE
ncbi:MAG: FAD:protein FMN transferase, partial [Bacilli bacterium]|nr:FAD:protein FMN transferase [Bacilli bacterium]